MHWALYIKQNFFGYNAFCGQTLQVVVLEIGKNRLSTGQVTRKIYSTCSPVSTLKKNCLIMAQAQPAVIMISEASLGRTIMWRYWSRYNAAGRRVKINKRSKRPSAVWNSAFNWSLIPRTSLIIKPIVVVRPQLYSSSHSNSSVLIFVFLAQHYPYCFCAAKSKTIFVCVC